MKKIAQHFIDWWKTFLSVRDLKRATKKPLWSYKTTDEEFNELKQLLIDHFSEFEDTQKALEFNSMVFRPLFVLYAVEQWRRNYSGGSWSWSDICKPLGIDHQRNYNELRIVIEEGLNHWGQEIHLSKHAKEVLATISCQGGIPEVYLRGENAGSLRKYFLTVLEKYKKFHRSIAAEAIAEEFGELLPSSLQQQSLYELTATLVHELHDLKNTFNLNGLENPLVVLELECPNWRDRFPITLKNESSDELLGNLIDSVNEVVVERVSHPIKVIRLLEHKNDQWHIQSKIHINQFIHADDMSRILNNNQLPQFMELTSISSEERYTTALMSKNKGGDWQIHRKHTLIEDTKSLESDLYFEAWSDDQKISSGFYYKGEGLNPDLPWVFAGTKTGWRYLGDKSWRFKEEEVIVLWHEAPKVTSDQSSIELCGTLNSSSRLVYRVRGEVQVSILGQECVIRTNTHEEKKKSYSLEGKIFPYSTSEDIYLGPPKVFTEEGGIKYQLQGVDLVWVRLGDSKTVNLSHAGNLPGKGHLLVKNEGELVWQKSLIIIPESAEINLEDLGRGLQTHSLNNLGIDAVVSIEEQEKWLREVVAQENGFELEVQLPRILPLAMTYNVKWPFGGETQLSVPTGANGICLILPDGRVKPKDYRLTLDELYRSKLRVVCTDFSARTHFKISARLQNRDEVKGLVTELVELENVEEQEINVDQLIRVASELFSLSDNVWDEVSFKIFNSRLQAKPIDGVINQFKHLLKAPKESFDGAITQAFAQIEDKQETVYTLSMADAHSSPESIKIYATPFYEPEKERIEIHSEINGDEVNFKLDESQFEPGPWLLFADKHHRIQPTAYISKGETQKVDSTKATLREAINSGDSSTFKKLIDTLSKDHNHPDWAKVSSYITAFEEVEPRSIMLWRHMARNSHAMTLALLNCSTEDTFEQFWMFQRKLPFSWYLVTLKDWRSAFIQIQDILWTQANKLEIPDNIKQSIFKSNLEQKLIWLKKQGPSFSRIAEVLIKDFMQESALWFDETPLENQYQQYMPFMTERDKLFKRHKSRLLSRIQNRDKDQELLGEFSHLRSVIPRELHWLLLSLRLKEEKPKAWESQVLCCELPVVLALWSLEIIDSEDGLPMNFEGFPTLIKFAIRRLRNFDQEWFDHAYALAFEAGYHWQQKSKKKTFA